MSRERFGYVVRYRVTRTSASNPLVVKGVPPPLPPPPYRSLGPRCVITLVWNGPSHRYHVPGQLGTRRVGAKDVPSAFRLEGTVGDKSTLFMI